MKFYSSILILIVFMVSSCHHSYDSIGNCTDGIQNQEETGIDCGGPCKKLCGTNPPCSPNNNTITFGSSTYNVTIQSCAEISYYYKISGIGNDNVHFSILMNDKPWTPQILTTSKNISPSNSGNIKVSFQDDQGFTYVTDPGFPVHINFNELDQLVVTFCNLPFSNSMKGSAEITCS